MQLAIAQPEAAPCQDRVNKSLNRPAYNDGFQVNFHQKRYDW